VGAPPIARGHDGRVTTSSEPSRDGLPRDPEAYDSPRAERARAKGLKAPYITGGDDPGIARARAEERRLTRILLAMVIVIVSAGFIIGLVVAILAPSAG
jgi:hypothetical protein